MMANETNIIQAAAVVSALHGKSFEVLLTKIMFNIYSKRNPKKYPHTIYAEGHLDMIQVTNKQSEYVNGRDIGGMLKLKFTDTKVQYFKSVE